MQLSPRGRLIADSSRQVQLGFGKLNEPWPIELALSCARQRVDHDQAGGHTRRWQSLCAELAQCLLIDGFARHDQSTQLGDTKRVVDCERARFRDSGERSHYGLD